jgi:hypothetical protein
MFDPGAMGTLLIGLNADRAEREAYRRQLVRAATRRERPGIRVLLARGLRHTAELLERPTIRELADRAW